MKESRHGTDGDKRKKEKKKRNYGNSMWKKEKK